MPGRAEPAVYAKLLDELFEKQNLKASAIARLGVTANLSRVASNLRRYIEIVAKRADIPPRFNVAVKNKSLVLEDIPVSNALILLALEPGRVPGAKTTTQLVAALRAYYDGGGDGFSVLRGGHLLSGDHENFLLLEGAPHMTYEALVHEFAVEVLEKLNAKLRKKFNVCFRCMSLPMMAGTVFDTEYIKSYDPSNHPNGHA